MDKMGMVLPAGGGMDSTCLIAARLSMDAGSGPLNTASAIASTEARVSSGVVVRVHVAAAAGGRGAPAAGSADGPGAAATAARESGPSSTTHTACACVGRVGREAGPSSVSPSSSSSPCSPRRPGLAECVEVNQGGRGRMVLWVGRRSHHNTATQHTKTERAVSLLVAMTQQATRQWRGNQIVQSPEQIDGMRLAVHTHLDCYKRQP